jgi:hypothetical protein
MKFNLISRKIEPLYCILHEEFAIPYPSSYAPINHSGWARSVEGPEFEDMYVCGFEGGWATCPPPEFGLDEYIDTHGAPPLVIESDFNPYDYDVERDEIIVEVLP